MSATDVEQALSEINYDVYLPDRDEPAAEYNGKRFTVIATHPKSGDEPPITFFFTNDELRVMWLEYAFLPHENPPGRSENACKAIFNRSIIAGITTQYGTPTKSTTEKNDKNRDETVIWASDKINAEAKMHIDGEAYPEIAEPRCGSLNATVFFGSAGEQKKFKDNLYRAGEKSRKHNP